MRVNDRYVSLYYELDDDIEKIQIDPNKTALLVIDMQKVFLERPSLENISERELEYYKKWEPFYDKIERVVIPNNKRLIEYCRKNNIEVIFAKIQCHKKNGSDRSLVQKATGFNELLLPIGSEKADIVPELSPIEDEIVITKTTDSAITGSNLRLILHNIGIDTVIVTGVFTDQCVSGTVRSLADESYHVWLIEDGCMASTTRIQANELEILNNIYCHVVSTQEVLDALKK